MRRRVNPSDTQAIQVNGDDIQTNENGSHSSDVVNCHVTLRSRGYCPRDVLPTRNKCAFIVVSTCQAGKLSIARSQASCQSFLTSIFEILTPSDSINAYFALSSVDLLESIAQ